MVYPWRACPRRRRGTLGIYKPGIIMQQRIVLGAVGAIAGGLALVTIGEWVRPKPAEARTSIATPVIKTAETDSYIYPDSTRCEVIQPVRRNYCRYHQCGPQARSLENPTWGDPLKAQILSRLPRDKDITVMAPLGDAEAIDLALQIHAFLAANGFKMKKSGISQGVFTQPQHGLNFNPETNTFIVGSR